MYNLWHLFNYFFRSYLLLRCCCSFMARLTPGILLTRFMINRKWNLNFFLIPKTNISICIFQFQCQLLLTQWNFCAPNHAFVFRLKSYWISLTLPFSVELIPRFSSWDCLATLPQPYKSTTWFRSSSCPRRGERLRSLTCRAWFHH